MISPFNQLSIAISIFLARSKRYCQKDVSPVFNYHRMRPIFIIIKKLHILPRIRISYFFTVRTYPILARWKGMNAMSDDNHNMHTSGYYAASNDSASETKKYPWDMGLLSGLLSRWGMKQPKLMQTPTEMPANNTNVSKTSDSSDKKVFVFKGYGNDGGAFLSYQIGRICHHQFGSPLFVVEHKQKVQRISSLKHPRFDYPFEFRDITIGQMKKMMKPNDLFICNPAFSKKWFGLNLPMEKLMYIQGMNTYPVLDIFFDHYVSVSEFIQLHVKNLYKKASPIISPFINHSVFENRTPWKERSNDMLILGYKGYASPMMRYLNEFYKEKYPESNIAYKMVNDLTQKELANLFNQHKYFLTLNPTEGFGLPPLEAMASGCAVIGFDSMGGRDYLEPDKNAYVVDYGDFERLAGYLRRIELNPDIGESLAKQGVETASRFSYDRFEKEWTKYLAEHVYKK